jgi:hypothetical protein
MMAFLWKMRRVNMVSLALVAQLFADLFVQKGTAQKRTTHKGPRGNAPHLTNLGPQMLVYRRTDRHRLSFG